MYMYVIYIYNIYIYIIYIYIYLLYDEREFSQLKHSIYLTYQYLKYLPTSFTRKVPQVRKIYSRVICDFE